MNRIRQINGIFQVLITPNIKISPDSSLMLGNWEDADLRNFYVLEFDNLQSAQCEAFKHPDIDWYRIILNHKYIFERLNRTIKNILEDYNVEYYSHLMSPEGFKNTIFDRVLQGGERFNTRYGFTDIISFTIVNPWSNTLKRISKNIEHFREHLYRDDVRIRSKKIIDDKIISLYGVTEFGTIFEIKLLPSLIYQWMTWHKRYGHTKQKYSESLYRKYLQMQDTIDRGQNLL